MHIILRAGSEQPNKEVVSFYGTKLNLCSCVQHGSLSFVSMNKERSLRSYSTTKDVAFSTNIYTVA